MYDNEVDVFMLGVTLGFVIGFISFALLLHVGVIDVSLFGLART